MAEKLILIDGNSIINRAFFGVPPLTNAAGLHTNAIYGFVNILFRILNEENGDYLCVAFDVHQPTFRHLMYPEYKGTRKGMPDELKEQVPVLKELLRAMGIFTIEKGGYEADDILGTLAKRGEADGKVVTLVSGDRDLLQIATDNILIRIPKTKGGKTEIEDYHTKDVVEKYGLTPLQIIELKGLMGDSSDNIPGVPKIGEKTATQLLIEYKDIANLKEHLTEISKNSIRQTLMDNFHMAELSRTLATIEINADIDFNYEDARIGNLYTKEAYAMVKELGFKNILSKFDENASSSADNYSDKFKMLDDFTLIEEVFAGLNKYEKVAFYIVGERDKDLVNQYKDARGIGICTSEEDIIYIPVAGMISSAYLCDRFVQAVKDSKDTTFITFDLKNQLHYIDEIAVPEYVASKFIDLAIGAYICNPLKNDYEVEDIANEYAGMLIKGKEEIFGKKGFALQEDNSSDELKNYACYYCLACLKTANQVIDKISEWGMLHLYSDIEMPVMVCLYDMEKQGIRILPDDLKAYGVKLGEEIALVEAKIYEEAGEEFNINSPIKLGEILFEKMGMPGGKKTKKGFSTAADVLEKLAEDYPFVSEILKYRALAKLKSTYADGLLNYVASDSRIHSTFNQTITATGRISSTEPNLQNIPVKMEQGKLIRKVFVPRDGYSFIDADYSQIELRIMAHLSQDEQMCNAFINGNDIHATTASEVYHVSIDDVTPLMRRNAKAVNFGIIYGISPFGLAKDLNIPQREAKEFIENYFVSFPGVKAYLDNGVENAKKNGFVTTAYGRRRPLPEISSSNFMQRQFGERVAMNAPIQGTAADIMKIAMIDVQKALRDANLKSKIILQIHDELLIEAANDEIDIVKPLLQEKMENAAKLSVPMTVEVSVSNNWYEAK